MNKNYIILKEEFPITEKELIDFEITQQIQFPKDYRDFLLEYNGGAIVPNYPRSQKLKTEIFPIDRFYSLGDLKAGIIGNQREIKIHVIHDIERKGYELNLQIKDKNGKTVAERIEILKENYEKYQARYGKISHSEK